MSAEIIEVDFKQRTYSNIGPDEAPPTIDDILEQSMGIYSTGIFIGISYADDDSDMLAFMSDMDMSDKHERVYMRKLLKEALELLK